MILFKIWVYKTTICYSCWSCQMGYMIWSLPSPHHTHFDHLYFLPDSCRHLSFWHPYERLGSTCFRRCSHVKVIIALKGHIEPSVALSLCSLLCGELLLKNDWLTDWISQESLWYLNFINLWKLSSASVKFAILSALGTKGCGRGGSSLT